MSRAAFRFISQRFIHREVETQARIYVIAVESNVFPFLSHKWVSLLLNAPHPDKIALTNGVNKSEFDHFHILRTFLVKFKKS